jgi:hypothetical protein
MTADQRWRTAIHEAGHAAAAYSLELRACSVELLSDSHGNTEVESPFPATRRMDEQTHRSRGTVAAAGNAAVQRLIGEQAAAEEQAEAAEGVLDDQAQIENRATDVHHLSGESTDDIARTFEAEAHELLDHVQVREAVARIARALVDGPGRLDATQLQELLDVPSATD